MSQLDKVEQALEEYGYSQKGKGGRVALIVMSLLLVLIVGAAGWLGLQWSSTKARALQAEQSLLSVGQRLSEMEIQNSELSAQLADKQTEIERLRQEWTSQVAQLETEHKEQMQRTYARMNQIVYDSKETLTYIEDIESRLRSGEQISREQAAELASVANGLALLKEKYKKPMAEFRELDQYFKRQLSTLSTSSSPTSYAVATPVRTGGEDPRETAGLFKKIFQNKKFQAERDAYLEEKGKERGIAQGVAEGRAQGIEVGKREALTQAQQVVRNAYARAQRQMGELSIDMDRYVVQLERLSQQEGANAAEIEAFFETSKQILQIHTEVMGTEPTRVEAVRP